MLAINSNFPALTPFCKGLSSFYISYPFNRTRTHFKNGIQTKQIQQLSLLHADSSALLLTVHWSKITKILKKLYIM